MAGTLTVNWNNSTPIGGPFRVAYRYPAWNGNPASAGYPGYVITSGVACGTPTCSTSIGISVITDEACIPLIIDGYIQPECNPEASLIGRILFSVTFTPSSPCEAVRFTVVDPTGSDIVGLGTGCHGLLGTLAIKAPGEQFSICYLGGFTGAAFLSVKAAIQAAGFLVEANPSVCCYDCVELTVTFDETVGNSPRVQYEKCTGSEPLIGSITFAAGIPSPPVTVCARLDSWSTDYPSSITYTTGGSCP